jgi:hypothetical protein
MHVALPPGPVSTSPGETRPNSTFTEAKPLILRATDATPLARNAVGQCGVALHVKRGHQRRKRPANTYFLSCPRRDRRRNSGALLRRLRGILWSGLRSIQYRGSLGSCEIHRAAAGTEYRYARTLVAERTIAFAVQPRRTRRSRWRRGDNPRARANDASPPASVGGARLRYWRFARLPGLGGEHLRFLCHGCSATLPRLTQRRRDDFRLCPVIVS